MIFIHGLSPRLRGNPGRSRAQRPCIIALWGARLVVAGIPEVGFSARSVETGFSSHSFSYGGWGFTAMAGNRPCFQPPLRQPGALWIGPGTWRSRRKGLLSSNGAAAGLWLLALRPKGRDPACAGPLDFVSPRGAGDVRVLVHLVWRSHKRVVFRRLWPAQLAQQRGPGEAPRYPGELAWRAALVIDRLSVSTSF